MGRGGVQVVSVLTFYSDDPGSNPAEVYSFSVKLVFERTKIIKLRPGLARFLNGKYFILILINSGVIDLRICCV